MFHQKDYPLIFIHERINRNKLRSCFGNLIVNSHQYNENAIIRKEFRYRVEIDVLEDFTPIDLD
ncbi:MAG: hypothetical protein MK238_08480 [Nitrospinales bacterium]|jgi:hypothetical protein|nr:hypothetical protein [Nitrospinales bacterium]